MSEDRIDGTKAYEVELDEGTSVFFLEGLGSKREAQAVCRELAAALDRQVRRRGQRHLLVAIPPAVRLQLVRGKRIKLETTGDNCVVLKIEDGSDSAIILPGGNRR